MRGLKQEPLVRHSVGQSPATLRPPRLAFSLTELSRPSRLSSRLMRQTGGLRGKRIGESAIGLLSQCRQSGSLAMSGGSFRGKSGGRSYAFGGTQDLIGPLLRDLRQEIQMVFPTLSWIDLSKLFLPTNRTGTLAVSPVRVSVGCGSVRR
jgi:hypothetical protein